MTEFIPFEHNNFAKDKNGKTYQVLCEFPAGCKIVNLYSDKIEVELASKKEGL